MCAYGSEADFRPLAYPLTQIISGVARLVPSARYFPLRVRCAKMLNLIAASTCTFIPVSMLLLDMLEMKELNRPPAGGVSKAVDLRTKLKVLLDLDVFCPCYCTMRLYCWCEFGEFSMLGKWDNAEDTGISGGMCSFSDWGASWAFSSVELFCCILWVVFYPTCPVAQLLQNYQSWEVPERSEAAYPSGMSIALLIWFAPPNL